MFCPNCGKEIHNEAVMCVHCGTMTGTGIMTDSEPEYGAVMPSVDIPAVTAKRKKLKIVLMIVCILGMLQVPLAMLWDLISLGQGFSSGFYTTSYGILELLLWIVPELFTSVVAAVSFVLIMLDKIPKLSAVLPISGILLFTGILIIRIFNIVQNFQYYDNMIRIYLIAWSILCPIVILCFILTLPGIFQPKACWLALASSLTAILCTTLNLAYIIVGFLSPAVSNSFISSIFFQVCFNTIFFFFGIAWVLYTNWKKQDDIIHKEQTSTENNAQALDASL